MSAPRATPAETSAPAAAYSASEIDAPAPAPLSTDTAAPNAMNLRTVSGVAATRFSPGAVSATTAIRSGAFISSGNQDDDDSRDDGDKRHRPLQHADEAAVGAI